MKFKLKGICQFCTKKRENIYGEKCSEAWYRDHVGGYGESWANNKCIHDQHHSREDLFVPIEELKLSKELEAANLKIKEAIETILKLEKENDTLRGLIKK